MVTMYPIETVEIRLYQPADLFIGASMMRQRAARMRMWTTWTRAASISRSQPAPTPLTERASSPASMVRKKSQRKRAGTATAKKILPMRDHIPTPPCGPAVSPGPREEE